MITKPSNTLENKVTVPTTFCSFRIKIKSGKDCNHSAIHTVTFVLQFYGYQLQQAHWTHA
jgi:hypothetical protein